MTKEWQEAANEKLIVRGSLLSLYCLALPGTPLLMCHHPTRLRTRSPSLVSPRRATPARARSSPPRAAHKQSSASFSFVVRRAGKYLMANPCTKNFDPLRKRVSGMGSIKAERIEGEMEQGSSCKYVWIQRRQPISFPCLGNSALSSVHLSTRMRYPLFLALGGSNDPKSNSNSFSAIDTRLTLFRSSDL